MAITNFQSEVWSSQLLSSLKRSMKFASPAVCNRSYEGEIQNAGDTVRITSIGRPTVATYTPGTTTVTPETLTDAQRSLLIDQSKYFAFLVDDVNKAQAANGGALLTEGAAEAAYALAATADTYVQSIIESDCAAGNIIGATQCTTSAKAVERLVALAKLLDDADVPTDGRYCIVPSWFKSLLILDDRAIMADGIRGGDELASGIVGRKLGFDIIQANYALSTGDDWYVYAGHPMAITFAEQINQVEAYRPQTSFSDAIKGLHLYGAKVVRPTAIAMNLCSVT